MGCSPSVRMRFHHRFHVVWVTEYRHGVLHGAMRERLRGTIRRTCDRTGARIVKASWRATTLTCSCRSRRIRMEFPELRKRRWGRRFRARGHFSTTSGNVTDDIMLQHLELHSKRDATGCPTPVPVDFR